MDDDPAPCRFCSSTNQVTWSLVFGHACASCRQQRTYQMLGEPVTALPVRDET